jgi:ferritin-like metal-binding protein YciE
MAEPTSLLTVFATQLANVTNMEKQISKLYLKLEQLAFAPELAKALSPVSTDSEQHLQRLALVKLSFKPQKLESGNKGIEIAPIKFSKKASSGFQDLHIVNNVLSLQNLKLAHYEFLHPLAMALELENEAALIEQTITDNRNTNTWLRQLIQNVIVPGLK